MFEQIWSKFLTKFGPTAMAEFMASLFPKLISALITLAFMYLIWLVISRTVRAVLTRFEVDETLRAFVQTLLRCSEFRVALGDRRRVARLLRPPVRDRLRMRLLE